MLINGIELNTLGVKLYDRVISSNQVETIQDWLDGDIQPTFIRQQDSFKSIKLEFLVLGADEQEAFLTISKLTKELRKCNLVFDDLPNLTFKATLDGTADPRRLSNGNFIVSYALSSDYAHGDREVYTTDVTATSSFKLTLLYYQNTTTLLNTETVTIRAAHFNKENVTLADLGINVNKYQPEYFSEGILSNFLGQELTYENLRALQTLIINYTPIRYTLQTSYFMEGENSIYNELLQENMSFTALQVAAAKSIGQIIDANAYKPDGYKARIAYTGALTVEALLAASPIYIYFDKVTVDTTKSVELIYQVENDEGGYDTLDVATAIFKDSNFVDGMTLSSVLPIDSRRPNIAYFNKGYIVDHGLDDLVSFEELNDSYTIRYSKIITTLFVEYYNGIYPGWYRLATIPVQVKYMSKYDIAFSIEDLNIDLDKYHTSAYERGVLYNGETLTSFEGIISTGVLQVYYTPIDYTISVKYFKDDQEIKQEYIDINDLMFMGNPLLRDIIPITENVPEGYQFDPELSYDGEVSLAGLTQTSVIYIVYAEIEEVRAINVILRYKKELSSAYSTVNTSIITIYENDVIGGIRLQDIFDLNAHKPEYYNEGIIDGASSTAIINFEDIEPLYNILYTASTYLTPVRYYTDEVSDLNWIASSNIQYRVIDFEADTTLFDLGLNLNAYKPSYSGDGVLEYNGPVNFESLIGLSSINVIYDTLEIPDDPDDPSIDYPHRFLFVQHNDLGKYENQYPSWDFQHAFINTGVSVNDMSKLTVTMECGRVDNNAPLDTVNEGYAYLFGSSSPAGSFYMRFNNQVHFGTGLTGVNTYEAKAGLNSAPLSLTEDAAIGFSANTGIYASERPGYSYATFTYTNSVATESVAMPYPLYLFANNNAGAYADGLGGIGIYSCRIYYEGNLIRDFIPVQFYDKIGSKVAPSNCLYDKVTETFFEAGAGQFNIIDDDRYPSDNPEHQIGHCYVQYYKGDNMFQTSTVYFRGSDFINAEWDPYVELMVDEHQPQYYEPGVVTNIDDFIEFTFDSVNNAVFIVRYEESDNQIVVNYYRDAATEAGLIATDIISLTEKDFYQAPTFGDIVRLNKYKPSGYETNFEYSDKRVTLNRVVANSPYNIVYTAAESPQTYTTQVLYKKKIYGLRTYETIAIDTLTFDDTDFRDGEYIDFYIDFNKYKPEQFYINGEPYEWYRMDERLLSPGDLRPLYEIYYMPDPVFIEVNYYRDAVAEENQIASTTWAIQIDDWESEFQIPDYLPNNYVNKFKPVSCAGGVIQDSNIWHTFESLVEAGAISIVYATVDEPHDPESLIRKKKVLGWGWWGNHAHYQGQMSGFGGGPEGAGPFGSFVGGRIPWIDLGYTPKEIGRLRVEMKGFAQSTGFESTTTQYGFQAPDYTYFFGYYGARSTESLGSSGADDLAILQAANGKMSSQFKSNFSPGSSGAFAIRSRLPVAGTWAYTSYGPQTLDGQVWCLPSGSWELPVLLKSGITGAFRRGNYLFENDDFEESLGFDEYSVSHILNYNYGDYTDFKTDGYIQSVLRSYYGYFPYGIPWSDNVCHHANPWTIILDAYNNYASIWCDLEPQKSNEFVFENTDHDWFEGRCQPKGSLTLFQTRNPDTGKMNIMPFNPVTYPFLGNAGFGLSGMVASNPYGGEYKTGITLETTVIEKEYDSEGNVVLTEHAITTTRNINYAKFCIPVFPQCGGCWIWYLKIYDRGRLVRDLIPVGKGEQIYDYIMPDNGLFDLVTEIFFGSSNEGGTYTGTEYGVMPDDQESGNTAPGIQNYPKTIVIRPYDEKETESWFSGLKWPSDMVLPLFTIDDPLTYGTITTNYYDYDNTFLTNQFVEVPTWFRSGINSIEDFLHFNDYKPDEYHLDGLLDLDKDLSFEAMSLKDIYDLGATNVFYKLRTFTKTVVYYRDNVRIASKDIFYSIKDIENARTLEDLGVDLDLYYTPEFAHGRVVFDEKILQTNNIQDFIDAPSPIVVYDKLTQEEAPNLLYLEYYRGGAYDDELITFNPNDPNYLDCDLDAVVLNPNGAIKYNDHYHEALYEDEVFDYFIPYQVWITNKYSGIHRGPARRYPTLAMVIEEDKYTIIEERNGWGRLKEYPVGWIKLDATVPVAGPGQNPNYDRPEMPTATIPFAEEIHLSRLTIDRLWAYCPEVESWIKAEDISYNQAGKLYNGLDIQVINLDEIDFSSVTSLTDMEIYPELRRLRFHDYSLYEWENEYTYEAFSNQHEIDFVYPETVYSYTCIYYRDNRAPDNELGRSAFTCTVSDWNPDWDIFIATSWQFDDQNSPMTPQLYRDTDLTLGWDYFGFDRNLFRPLGYSDGIYIWNPRSWNQEEVYFTFEELIATGSQFVVYPSFLPELYKGISPNEKFTLKGLSGEYFQLNNYNYLPNTTPSNYYDIHYEGLGRVEVSTSSYESMALYDSGASARSASVIYQYVSVYGNSSTYSHEVRAWTGGSSQINFTGRDQSDIAVVNMSNHRTSPSFVFGLRNYNLNKVARYWFVNSDGQKIEILPNTNIKNNYGFSNADAAWVTYYEEKNGERWDYSSSGSQYNGTQSWLETQSVHDVAISNFEFSSDALHYNFKLYKNFLLERYWCPVPKGMWYRFDGQDLQIPDNGFYDFITNVFKPVTGLKVYRVTQDALTESPFYYFSDWDFESQEANYVIKTKQAVNTYDRPDVLANSVRTLENGLVLPVSLVTADSANRVLGEWYFSSDQWLQTNQVDIYAGSFSLLNTTKTTGETTLLLNSRMPVYLDPTATESSITTYEQVDKVVKYYYIYNHNGVEYYFDGNLWFAKEHTSDNITTSNKNYAVAVNNTPIYKYPIANSAYLVNQLLIGERVTVLHVATEKPNWGYTGQGWVQISNNLSEVL